MCISKEEFFARLEAKKKEARGGGCELSPDERHDLREIRARRLQEPILLQDPGDETDFVVDEAAFIPADLARELSQDARIATLEGQIQALTERLVHLAVSHATLKAEVSLTWSARFGAWFARRRAYRPKLFMGR